MVTIKMAVWIGNTKYTGAFLYTYPFSDQNQNATPFTNFCLVRASSTTTEKENSKWLKKSMLATPFFFFFFYLLWYL